MDNEHITFTNGAPCTMLDAPMHQAHNVHILHFMHFHRREYCVDVIAACRLTFVSDNSKMMNDDPDDKVIVKAIYRLLKLPFEFFFFQIEF